MDGRVLVNMVTCHPGRWWPDLQVATQAGGVRASRALTDPLQLRDKVGDNKDILITRQALDLIVTFVPIQPDR